MHKVIEIIIIFCSSEKLKSLFICVLALSVFDRLQERLLLLLLCCLLVCLLVFVDTNTLLRGAGIRVVSAAAQDGDVLA